MICPSPEMGTGGHIKPCGRRQGVKKGGSAYEIFEILDSMISGTGISGSDWFFLQEDLP
jgi:hypothetical protein